MKQVLQDLAKGKTMLCQAPSPQLQKNHVIINTSKSLISIGTERMLVDFGKSSYIQKARQKPEKVRQVLDKVKTDGLKTTVDAVKAKLSEPLPLGYCNVGVVYNTLSDSPFSIGDRVVSNGPHADVVSVPYNLCAKIPENVSDEDASFTVLASIALQGIRLAKPTIGESFVVLGVGLIGLLAVQLLKANGARVLAVDYDEKKLNLAKEFGAEVCCLSKGDDILSFADAFSQSKGIDGVIITASTKSNEPVANAARMSRKRGRIILVGVTGLELNRSDFYEKELSFQVSCSYGPGRYDDAYEKKGQDYPFGFVRWTEQRNFEAILGLMAEGKLDISSLITHQFDFEDVVDAYDVLSDDKSALGILLNYESDIEERHQKHLSLQDTITPKAFKKKRGKITPVIAAIGAGNYASRILLPQFKKQAVSLDTIITSSGITSVTKGNKLGFLKATNDINEIWNSENINTVVISTRHNSHASFVCDALKTKKNVFVEKPLALTLTEIDEIEKIYRQLLNDSNVPKLMVGFNRRYSPLTIKLKELLQTSSSPKTFIMTMNAGFIPKDHWTQDKDVGGGRIIGEACHYIDLMRFLTGSRIKNFQASCIGKGHSNEIKEDKATITLTFEDGSMGTIHYFANGSAKFPKERVEAFFDSKIVVIDNFRKLEGYGFSNFKKMKLRKQDKGQQNCVSTFINSIINGDDAPIGLNEIFEVSRISIEIAESLNKQ